MKAPTPFDRIRKFFSKGKKGSFDIVYNDIVIYNIYIFVNIGALFLLCNFI